MEGGKPQKLEKNPRNKARIKNKLNSHSTRGPFLEGPRKFSHPKSRSKISNFVTPELFCADIRNINGGSLHMRS